MLNLTPTQHQLLTAYAHSAFQEAYKFRWPQPVGAGKQAKEEPQHVASMVLKGTKMLRQRFMPFLRVLYPTAQISSVYIHQSPYVNWSTNRCELGDLLMVVRPDPACNPYAGYALLVQTKMSSVGIVTTPDPVQYDLYTAWPTFNVEDSGGLSCTLPNAVAGYGKYGLILRHGASKHSREKWRGRRRPWAVLAPATPLNVNNGSGLADTLVSLMQGHAGVAFNGNGNDWSRLIKFLLDNTFAKPLTLDSLLSAFPSKARRGQHSFLAYSFSAVHGWRTWSLAAAPGKPDNPEYMPWFPNANTEWGSARAGISTIMIDLNTSHS